MQALRHLFLNHRSLAVLVCALALALRVLIPGGYMVSAGPHGWAITLCPGTVPAVAAPMAGMAHGGTHVPSKEHGRAELPCAFAGLSAPLLGGVDAVLPVAALAFVAVLALRSRPTEPVRPSPYLRPPSRGPPALV